MCHVYSGDEIKEAMTELVKECKEKTGASDADIESLRNHKLPESKEGVCMFECFFDKANVMVDGKYHKEGLINALTPLMGGDMEKMLKLNLMAETCGEQVSNEGDKCEIAQKLMHCTVEEGKKFGFEYPSNF